MAKQADSNFITEQRLSRRMVLAGAAAIPAVAAASAPAVAGLGRTSTNVTEKENPALLELGAKLDPAVAAFHAAGERKKAARAAAEAACPQLPAALIAQPGDALRRFYTVEEIDVEDQVVRPAGKGQCRGSITTEDSTRRVFRSDLLRSCVLDAEFDYPARARKKVVARAHALIPIAEKFEADRKAAIEQSGLHAAKSDEENCAAELDFIARDTLRLRANSMVGAAIMARAVIAQRETWGKAGLTSAPCASHLAEAVLRLAPTR